MVSELLLLAALIWVLFFRNSAPAFSMNSSLSKRTPEEKLTAIVRFMRKQGLTPQQLAQIWDSVPADAPRRLPARDVMTRILLLLGAVFVLAGVCVYIQSFWDSMSSFSRIGMTYGVGLGLSLFSIHMMRDDRSEKSVLPFIILAALFEVGGLGVMLHEFFPETNDPRKAALFCLGVMALKQAALFHVFRHDALLFTALIFFYGALDALLDLMGLQQEHIAMLLGGSLFFSAHIISRTAHEALAVPFYLFAAMWFGSGMFVSVENATSISTAALVTGVSYFLLAHTIDKRGYVHLSILGYVVAALVMTSGIYLKIEEPYGYALASTVSGLCLFSMGLGFLKDERMGNLSALLLFFGSATFYCGLFDEVRHTRLELLYFVLSLYAVYASTLLHSRALLFTSVLAILGFIGYYTEEHFLHSVGWPVALIIMGVAFLGVGSAAIRIKRKYDM